MIILMLFLFTWVQGEQIQVELNPELLQNKLDDFVIYSLNRGYIQKYLNNLTFQEKPLAGNELLNSLVEKFTKTFQQKIHAVKQLAVSARISYIRSAVAQPLCCHPQTKGKYDPHFKQVVDTSSICYLLSPIAASNSIGLSNRFGETCIDNLNNDTFLRWQYFTSAHGVTARFPSRQEFSCYDNDERFSPWYIQASIPRSSHVVIVVDNSGSMTELYKGVTRISLAQETAKLILQTLNPYDKVAVLAISDIQQTLHNYNKRSDCFETYLAQATQNNKMKFAHFIEKLSPRGGTYYVEGLQKAFEYFKTEANSSADSETNTSSVYRIIHFLSDGSSNDAPKDILAALDVKRKELNNSVILATYGVGDTDFSTLKSMAKNTEEKFMEDAFYTITSSMEIKRQLASFYKSFTSKVELISEPIWTVPYQDTNNLGLMMTTALPVYVNKEMIGAVGIDMTMRELMEDSTQFTPNQLTYSFLIDNTGLLIHHPLLAYENIQLGEVKIVSALAYERDEEFIEVFESMKRGESGNKTFLSTQVLSEGSSKRHGVVENKVEATYYWRKIPNTKFSLALVAIGSSVSVLASMKPKKKNSLLYHRFDIIPPSKPCLHFERYCSMDKSSFFLSSHCFNDTSYYYNHEFTKKDVENLLKYIDGDGENLNKLKEGVKENVIVTQIVEHLWQQEHENTILQADLLWRYIATYDGVFRIFPGTEVTKDFDPSTRPWYENALVHSSKSRAITAPHLDAISGNVIVSISALLFKGRSHDEKTHRTEEIFGVLGGDIILAHFNELFSNLYPVCGSKSIYRCYLVDKAGYVIFNNKYLSDHAKMLELYKQANWEVHLAEMEPEMTSILIRDGVLKPTNCTKVKEGVLQKTYRIPEDQTVHWGSYQKSVFEMYSFKILPVAGSNSYILIALVSRTPECPATYFSCPCTHATCISKESEKENCECPCYQDSPEYNPCFNRYMLTNSSSLPCTPEIRNIRPYDGDKNFNKSLNLSVCYRTRFDIPVFRSEDPRIVYIIPSFVIGTLFFLGTIFMLFNTPQIVYLALKSEINEKSEQKASENNFPVSLYEADPKSAQSINE